MTSPGTPPAEPSSQPTYDDDVGWVRFDGLIDAQRAAELAARCALVADQLTDPRSGDKPHGATRRLTALDERIPELGRTVEAVMDRIGPAIDQIMTNEWVLGEVAWRCPGPGTGHQQLHADDTPRLDGGPARGATAIIALVDFTVDNGSTRVVPGSHRRPDLQRQSQRLEHHPDEVLLLGPAGTGFLFVSHLLHSGTTNSSDQPRPALQLSFRAANPVQPTGTVS